MLRPSKESDKGIVCDTMPAASDSTNPEAGHNASLHKDILSRVLNTKLKRPAMIPILLPSGFCLEIRLSLRSTICTLSETSRNLFPTSHSASRSQHSPCPKPSFSNSSKRITSYPLKVNAVAYAWKNTIPSPVKRDPLR